MAVTPNEEIAPKADTPAAAASRGPSTLHQAAYDGFADLFKNSKPNIPADGQLTITPLVAFAQAPRPQGSIPDVPPQLPVPDRSIDRTMRAPLTGARGQEFSTLKEMEDGTASITTSLFGTRHRLESNAFLTGLRGEKSFDTVNGGRLLTTSLHSVADRQNEYYHVPKTMWPAGRENALITREQLLNAVARLPKTTKEYPEQKWQFDFVLKNFDKISGGGATISIKQLQDYYNRGTTIDVTIAGQNFRATKIDSRFAQDIALLRIPVTRAQNDLLPANLPLANEPAKPGANVRAFGNVHGNDYRRDGKVLRIGSMVPGDSNDFVITNQCIVRGQSGGFNAVLYGGTGPNEPAAVIGVNHATDNPGFETPAKCEAGYTQIQELQKMLDHYARRLGLPRPHR